MARNIAIIGQGHVGQALGAGLGRAGHAVRYGTRETDSIRATTAWADVIILAAPWTALAEIAAAAGHALDGKPVVDVSNVMTPSHELALGFTTSGAEELQQRMPNAHVIKAFNTIFARHMSTGQLKGERLCVFIAGDNEQSKEIVQVLAEDIGFDAIDAGPLKSARYLEPLGMLNIMLGYGLNMGADIGFKLVR